MALSRDLGFQTNPAIRARTRELAERPSMDDYDRGVLMLLDDFARAMVLIAALSDANKRHAPVEPRDILREWFGGERYARDYEYLDANFMPMAKRVADFLAV